MKLRNVPKWSKFKLNVTRDWIESEEILTFDWMDWMYWKFIDDKGTILNALADAYEIEPNLYSFNQPNE